MSRRPMSKSSVEISALICSLKSQICFTAQSDGDYVALIKKKKEQANTIQEAFFQSIYFYMTWQKKHRCN